MKTTIASSSHKNDRVVSASKITEKEAKQALRRSGYLLESRAEAALRRRGWYVEANSAYEDQETSKSRELDIYALTSAKVSADMDIVFTSVLAECVNNPQPIALITKNPAMRDFAILDIKSVVDPTHVLLRESEQPVAMETLLNIT